MNILLTRTLPSSVLAKLEPLGHVDVFSGDGVDARYDELVARVAGKDAVVSMLTERIDKGVIDAGANLKIVANVAVGA